MPMYDYRCASGHRFERIVALDDPRPQACPACGEGSAKLPSRVALGGLADTGRPMELMPQTWRGTHDGNREYIGQLRGEWDRRRRLEDKHPELQGDRRPILAHEGRYENSPLRQGDPMPGTGAAPAGGHTHSRGHSHDHGHSHAPTSPAPAPGGPTP